MLMPCLRTLTEPAQASALGAGITLLPRTTLLLHCSSPHLCSANLSQITWWGHGVPTVTSSLGNFSEFLKWHGRPSLGPPSKGASTSFALSRALCCSVMDSAGDRRHDLHHRLY